MDPFLPSRALIADLPGGLGALIAAGRKLARLAYAHNPLYAASAWMIFRGLRASFDTDGGTFNTTMLTLGLAGYTLLLAITVYVVIRAGKVWDDARSLLLLIVLMFLGISVTFDEVLAKNPSTGVWCCVGGWALAALLSELLLRAIRLRLPILFRAPYHLLLALFYLYPVTLIPSITDPTSSLLQWQLFGFGVAAAMSLLTLLPAVRRGPSYVCDNGSPWPWPGFPWALFGVLGACAALRAYYLCISLHFVDYADSIFGPYFLIPLGFAAASLLLEQGLATGSRLATRIAIALPAGMIVLAAVGHRDDRVYRGFLQLFESGLGGLPLYLATVLAIVFYAIGAVRQVRFAGEALTVALVFWAFVEPGALDLGQLSAPRSAPLALAGAWQLAMGVRLGASWRLLVGNWALLAALTIHFEHTWFTVGHGAAPLHLAVVTLLTIGFWIDDRFSRVARHVGTTFAVLLAVWFTFGRAAWLTGLPTWALTSQPLLLAGLLFLLGIRLREHWSLAAAAACVALWVSSISWRIYDQMRPQLQGLNQLAWGVLFFVLATLVSLSKTGLLAPKLNRFKHSTGESAPAEPSS